MFKFLLKLVFAFALVVVPGGIAWATTYTYGCADLTSGDSPSCTGGAWTKASAFSLLKADDTKPFAVGTWYLSATVEGSGTPFRATCYEYTGAICNTYTALSAGDVVDAPITINSVGSLGLYLWGQTSTNPGISEICVTDTPGDCQEAPEAPPASVFDDLFGSATSSASSTISIVFDPNRDMFNLFFLFLSGFFGMYWLFSKKR